MRTIVLDEKTNDRSLVMTSSFTNMVLAGRALGGEPEACEARARGLARAGRGPAARAAPTRLAAVARSGFGSVVYLGSGCRLGSAREAALKMLEMNAGDVLTFAESYLGPAPRAHVGDPPGHPGGGLPLVRPARARLRAGPARASSTARTSARAA